MPIIKRALFVSPWPRHAKIIMEASMYPPMGLAYTAAYLEAQGVTCAILDANLEQWDEGEVLKKIEAFNPDLVGLTFNIATVKEATMIAKAAKTRLGKAVVLGGPSSAGDVRDILRKSQADCVVYGEGERVMAHLVENEMDLAHTNGLIYLDREGQMVKTPKEQKLTPKELDEMPFPAYHLLPNLDRYKNRSRRHPIAPMVTSRGCPCACTFCGSALSGWRPRSPESVVKEIEHLMTTFGVKQVDILDDNFTLVAERAEKICDLIIEKKLGIYITFPNGLRADRLTQGLVKKLAQAGVYRTGLGIESGDQKILDGIKKSLTLDQVRQAVRWLREEGITVFGYFQFGLPGESKETMERTIAFAREVNPHWANFGITTPLPGTELYAQLKAEGKLDVKEDEGITSGFYSVKEGHVLSNGLKREDILEYQRKAWLQFYFRPKKVLDVLGTIRSYRELQWTVGLAWPIFKSIFSPYKQGQSS